jgi:hypothetical protein
LNAKAGKANGRWVWRGVEGGLVKECFEVQRLAAPCARLDLDQFKGLFERAALWRDLGNAARTWDSILDSAVFFIGLMFCSPIFGVNGTT